MALSLVIWEEMLSLWDCEHLLIKKCWNICFAPVHDSCLGQLLCTDCLNNWESGELVHPKEGCSSLSMSLSPEWGLYRLQGLEMFGCNSIIQNTWASQPPSLWASSLYLLEMLLRSSYPLKREGSEIGKNNKIPIFRIVSVCFLLLSQNSWGLVICKENFVHDSGSPKV